MWNRISPGRLAFLAAAVAAMVAAFASFLPFFIARAWGPLWGLEWGRAEAGRSFGRVAPICGFSDWAELLAVPIAMGLVVSVFVLTVAAVLGSRRGAPRSHPPAPGAGPGLRD